MSKLFLLLVTASFFHSLLNAQTYTWTNKCPQKINISFKYDMPIGPSSNMLLSKEINPGESLKFNNLLGSVTQAIISTNGFWNGKFKILYMGNCATCNSPGNYDITMTPPPLLQPTTQPAINKARPTQSSAQFIPPKINPPTPPISIKVYPGENISVLSGFHRFDWQTLATSVKVFDMNDQLMHDCNSTINASDVEYQYTNKSPDRLVPLKVVADYQVYPNGSLIRAGFDNPQNGYLESQKAYYYTFEYPTVTVTILLKNVSKLRPNFTPNKPFTPFGAR